jgi:DNA-binding transcriptional ArsR family regulator
MRETSREITLDISRLRDYCREMPSERPRKRRTGAADPDPHHGLRQITDARTLRALAHPVRIALIETLATEGPMTATEVAERLGESPTTCSFHLRQLAKYDFVEEAGGGKGRARPWRISNIGMQLSAGDDPELEIASNALMRIVRERQLDRYRTWLETRGTFPKEWRKAAGEGEWLFHLTAEELEALNNELVAFLVPRFRERLTDPAKRPPGSVPVEMLMFSYPVALPRREK